MDALALDALDVEVLLQHSIVVIGSAKDLNSFNLSVFNKGIKVSVYSSPTDRWMLLDN